MIAGCILNLREKLSGFDKKNIHMLVVYKSGREYFFDTNNMDSRVAVDEICRCFKGKDSAFLLFIFIVDGY